MLNNTVHPMANEGSAFTILSFVTLRTRVAVLPYVNKEWRAFADTNSYAQ